MSNRGDFSILPRELVAVIADNAGKTGRTMLRYTCSSLAGMLLRDPQEEVEAAREFALASNSVLLHIILARSHHGADTILQLRRMIVGEAPMAIVRSCYGWHFIANETVHRYLRCYWNGVCDHRRMLDMVHLIGVKVYGYLSKPHF